MTYMDEFLASTRRRVEEATQKLSQEGFEQRIAALAPPRDFRGALDEWYGGGPEVAVIAEIKRVSPAKGPLNVHLNASQVAAAYARAGAAAISVVTEPDHFEGTMDDLEAARTAGPPVLRKDFIIDTFQVLESRAAGADAVLLIVRCLGDELSGLLSATRALGMQALVEVHDEAELERALATGAEVIGVNHRNLDTFEVDPDRTVKLAPLVPEDRTLVALSGVATRRDIEQLGAAGASAVLVGETLVTADDPEAKLRELLGR
jgi:indole-3-glycerol phosphate synthase